MQRHDCIFMYNSNACEPDHEKTCLMPCANNKGADQSAHPRSLISAFVVRCLDSLIPILAISKVSRLASVSDQGGLSLTCSQIPEDTFSRFKGTTLYDVFICAKQSVAACGEACL